MKAPSKEEKTGKKPLELLNISINDILRKISSPVLILDNEQKIIFFNPSAKRFFNIADSYINKNYSKLIKGKKSSETAKKAIDELLESKKRTKIAHIQYKAEDTRTIKTCFSKIKTEAGGVFVLAEISKIDFLNKDLPTVKSKEKVSQIEEESGNFKALIESSRDVIMRFDRKLRHVYVNPEIERQLGISPVEMIGKTHRELGFPESLIEKWEPALKKVFATGKEYRIEFNLPNGIWIDWLLVPEFDRKGKVKYVITSARDITNIKKYENEIIELNKSLRRKVEEKTKALKEKNAKLLKEIKENKKKEKQILRNEKKFRDLFELSASGIVVTDTKGKILEANERFSKIIGYTKEELLNMSVFDISYPGTEYLAKKNLKLLRNKKLLHHTVKNITKSNDVVILELYEKMIEDDDGNEIILITINDITERIKGEQEAFQKDLMYKTLFDYSPAGIILENSKGRIVAVNKALSASLGYSPEELIGKHISFLAPEEDEEFVSNNIRSILSGKVLQHRVNSLRKDGKIRIFELSEIKIPLSADEEGILVISKDVSELVEREEHLIKAKEATEKAMKFKSEFFAQMSHEIRSPINLILSYINLIKEDLGINLNEIQKVSFNGIESAGKRVLRTIESILNISEMEAGLYETKFREIDFLEILEKLSAEYKHYAEIRGLSFEFENTAERTEIIADEYSSMQIISNLLDNAIKYTKEGKVTLRAFNEGDFLKVEVKDTGIGISKDFLPKLFEAFEQEEKSGKARSSGTGIGLALVKKYCEINKAKIEVKSKKNVGSSFTVSFALKK